MEKEKVPAVVAWFWKLHRWVYRASSGRIGKTIGSMETLLLTTTGRKSGLPRDIVITYFEIDRKLVIIGSNLGRSHHPAWVHNLRADPRVSVRIGTHVRPMTAREAEGEEREHLWAEVVKRERAYRQYGKSAGRRIPVVVLETGPGVQPDEIS